MDTSSPSRHLVIFGCGYVGSALAKQALAEGWRVTALTRNAGKAEVLARSGLQVVVADATGSDWQAAIDRPVDAVVNCLSSGAGGVSGYQHSYHDAQQVIVAWAAKLGVPTYVYTSSTSVYPQEDGSVVDEASLTDTASPLASILLAAERQLLPPPTGIGRAFVLRLAGIYGPGRHYLLDSLRAGQKTFPPSDFRLNLIHRDDIVAAILTCLNAGPAHPGGLYNLADGQGATKASIVEGVAELLGLSGITFDAAVPDARQARRQAAGRLGRPDRHISAEKFAREFGWRPHYADYRQAYAALLSASADGAGT